MFGIFFVPFAAFVVRFTYYDCIYIRTLYIFLSAYTCVCMRVYGWAFVSFGRTCMHGWIWHRDKVRERKSERERHIRLYAAQTKSTNSPSHMSIQRALQCWYSLENAEVAVKAKERYAIGQRRQRKHIHHTPTQVAAAIAAAPATPTNAHTCSHAYTQSRPFTHSLVHRYWHRHLQAGLYDRNISLHVFPICSFFILILSSFFSSSMTSQLSEP